MKPDSILYYPHIEFNNEAWVKSSLLLWDHVYRIVPDGYEPNDSDEIKALVDEGLVRNIKLTEKDKEDTVNEFLSLCDIIEKHMPAGLIPSDDERIHPDKIDNRLYPYLDLIGSYFIDDDNWLHLSIELARGYMFKLSQVVARIRNLNRGTDDLDAWSINPYFCENANFGDFLQDPTAEGFFCSVTLEDVLPQNIGGVNSRELISFVNKRKDERKLLREKFNDFINHLAKVSDIQFADQLREDFVKELLDSKEQYRKSMDDWRDIAAISISTGVPMSIAAWSGLTTLDLNPFDPVPIVGGLVIGGICSYIDFKKTKKKRDPSYSSYLIDIDSLKSNLSYQCFSRLEEFIND